MLTMPMIGAPRCPSFRRGVREVRFERSRMPCSRRVLLGMAYSQAEDRFVRRRSLLGPAESLLRGSRLASLASARSRPAICRGERDLFRSARTRSRNSGSASKRRVFGRRRRCCAAASAAGTAYPSGPRFRAISRHTTEGHRPIRSAIARIEHPAVSPAAICARSTTDNTRHTKPQPSSTSPNRQRCYDSAHETKSDAKNRMQKA